MDKKLDLKEMYMLMIEYFGNKVSSQYINSEKQEIIAVLYDSFVFCFGIDDRYDLFSGGIVLDAEQVLTTFLGKKLSINNDKQSILSNFEIIDNYCRLRLPDKFLTEYDKINK